jgi:hypothetical protein
MISGMQRIQLHALLSISQKLHTILPPVLQNSDWPCHMNRPLTATIRLDEFDLRNTHPHFYTTLNCNSTTTFMRQEWTPFTLFDYPLKDTNNNAAMAHAQPG